jgi:hypothetical protein
MARLSTLITELQQRFADHHGGEEAQIRALAAELKRQGEVIEDRLDDLLEDYQAHRAELARKLVTLAGAMGLIPKIEDAPAKSVPSAAAIDAAIDGANVSTAAIESQRLPRFLQGMGRPAHRVGASDAHFASAPGGGQPVPAVAAKH